MAEAKNFKARGAACSVRNAIQATFVSIGFLRIDRLSDRLPLSSTLVQNDEISLMNKKIKRTKVTAFGSQSLR